MSVGFLMTMTMELIVLNQMDEHRFHLKTNHICKCGPYNSVQVHVKYGWSTITTGRLILTHDFYDHKGINY